MILLNMVMVEQAATGSAEGWVVVGIRVAVNSGLLVLMVALHLRSIWRWHLRDIKYLEGRVNALETELRALKYPGLWRA